MEEQLIIAGFGGQGVQLMGQLLAKSGMKEEKYVSFLPSYGPEMRGGTTNCNVVLSDDPIASRMKVSTLIESLPGYGKAKAAKIPPKIRVFSFIMLMCFMMTYIVIIVYQIVNSLGSLF